MKVLGIESSCDECSASVVESTPNTPDTIPTFNVLSIATHSQIKIHRPFGGVVPEVASRNHLETIQTIVDKALIDSKTSIKQIDAIAIANRPGLVGSLLVGVSVAKTLAYAFNKPLVAVHHLEGHASSIFLSPKSKQIELPLLLAIVSGGHTNLYLAKEPPSKWPNDFLQSALLGRSRDDAAGEAFDKTAKILGFPYPGGVWIEKHSTGGDPNAYKLPRALPQKSVYDFSFSGLKTAAAILIRQLTENNQLEKNLSNICASIQEAIIDALLKKIIQAGHDFNCKSIAIVGGVAANQELKRRLKQEWREDRIFFPPIEYCTDNAAMVAASGSIRYLQGHTLSKDELLKLNAFAQSPY